MKHSTLLAVAALAGLAASTEQAATSMTGFGQAIKYAHAKSGNNRAERSQQRRAKNKAARKSRMQQRRKAKQRGLTLIEVLIAVAICGILATVLISALDATGDAPTVSFGFNGITEQRCIGGFKFIVGQSGSVQQILDGQGHGVACK